MSELNAIAEFLGVQPEEGKELTIDALKQHVQTNYVPVTAIRERRDLIDPIVTEALGKAFGPAQTALVAQAKELGIEVKHSDYDGKKLVEIVPDLFGKVKARFDEFKGKKPDEQLTAELQRVKGEFENLKNDYGTKLTEYETYRQQVEHDKINAQKNIVRSQAFGNVKFKPSMSEFERTGFESIIEKNFDIQIGDDGNSYAIFATGEKKGSRVPSPARADQFLTFADLVKMEAEKNKLVADPREGQPAWPNGQQRQQQPQQPGQPQAGKRKISPRAYGM